MWMVFFSVIFTAHTVLAKKSEKKKKKNQAISNYFNEISMV